MSAMLVYRPLTTTRSGPARRSTGFVIVSKDADFHQRSFLLGHPPKVVWIRRGNCSTVEIEGILRSHEADLLAFAREEQEAFLALN
jgi:predicted nuclease of predicted toxin-antitoxin system